jgi:hypothetical protein
MKREHYIAMYYFGVKDTLNPINEYVEEIKASDEYKKYIVYYEY